MKNTLFMRGGFVVIAFTITALAAQASPSVEERLAALEVAFDAMARENAELRKQLGWIGKNAGIVPTPGGKETKLSVGGFLQGQAEFGHASDPRWNGIRDRLFFRRARIYVAGSFAEDFDFKAELDLQGNTLGSGTGQLARANEIYINWHKYSFANLRFGQLKPAFGVEALASDTKLLTIERSLSSDRLADGRNLAFSVAGDLFEKKVGYLAVVANGNGANVSANDNSKFQQSARIAFTPFATATDKLVVGVDGLWAEDAGVSKNDFGFTGNLFTGKREMTGLDAQWTHGRFDLSGERLNGTFKPRNAIPIARVKAAGWHITAAFYIVPNRLQAVYRHEEFDPNSELGGNAIKTDLFGLNYLIKGDDIKLGVNYLNGSIPGSTTDNDRLVTRIQIIF